MLKKNLITININFMKEIKRSLFRLYSSVTYNLFDKSHLKINICFLFIQIQF